MALVNARLSERSLKGYRVTQDPKSDLVRLLSPVGEDHAYYALYGWVPGGALEFSDVPGAARPLWRLRVGAADAASAEALAGRIASLGFGRPQIVRE